MSIPTLALQKTMRCADPPTVDRFHPPCLYGREHVFQELLRPNKTPVQMCRFCYYTPHKPPRRKTTKKRPTLKGAAMILRAQMEDRCVYCGTLLTDKTRTVDHVVPRSHGGMDHISNYLLACLACNESKGESSVHTWLGRPDPPFLLFRLPSRDMQS